MSIEGEQGSRYLLIYCACSLHSGRCFEVHMSHCDYYSRRLYVPSDKDLRRCKYSQKRELICTALVWGCWFWQLECKVFRCKHTYLSLEEACEGSPSYWATLRCYSNIFICTTIHDRRLACRRIILERATGTRRHNFKLSPWQEAGLSNKSNDNSNGMKIHLNCHF